jgi:hypothetical protein
MQLFSKINVFIYHRDAAMSRPKEAGRIMKVSWRNGESDNRRAAQCEQPVPREMDFVDCQKDGVIGEDS